MARAIRHTIATGYITARDVLNMGTNDTGKMFSRMRRMGVLYPVDHPQAFYLRPNREGNGQHRVHRWTGKLPASWVHHPAAERRHRKRGEK